MNTREWGGYIDIRIWEILCQREERAEEKKPLFKSYLKRLIVMSDGNTSKVIIENVGKDLRNTIEGIMETLAPKSFAGASVLIKPNMVGPSAPELGHTTHPELVRAVVLSCLDRNGKVWVGDNPGGINRSSRNVAKITGILDASNGCFTPISERVVEKTGVETNFPLVISRPLWRPTILSTFPFSRPI